MIMKEYKRPELRQVRIETDDICQIRPGSFRPEP